MTSFHIKANQALRIYQFQEIQADVWHAKSTYCGCASIAYSRKCRIFFRASVGNAKTGGNEPKDGLPFFSPEIEQHVKGSLWIEFFFVKFRRKELCALCFVG
ncbi:hypothetical protein CEXT_758891 [Caerostris extrusa]|uniref:Uncharacterized protein n=1 Tax=Caerostris extrusa TaxID=172846 RepID=A0AAV4SQI4_CAEEX|nr:hypothetical protein CEXT_758891 [Caerostris extrusa]